MDGLILQLILVFIAAAILIVVILNLIQGKKNNKIKHELENLDKEKNIIESMPITNELAKIEALNRNEKLNALYNEWKDRLNGIKVNQIPKITDMLLEADFALQQMDYKNTAYKIAKIEMELYKVKASSSNLLDEIKVITSSEEKNRNIITKLKHTYRELYQNFQDNKNEFGEVTKSVELQFENIANRYDDFEKCMENNQYEDVEGIINAIEEMQEHMKIVLDEVPGIVLTATNVVPKKIAEVSRIHQTMTEEGYPLDYLNIEYNVLESNKKIDDIIARTKVLNLEDSAFELKTLLEYFDSVFNDFEKEKMARSNYEETNYNFSVKITKLNQLLTGIYHQLDAIKDVYNLTEKDIAVLNNLNQQLNSLNADYKVLIDHTSNHIFPFSKLIKELEALMIRLVKLEDDIDTSLDAIGNMKEDELRARQQLEEIKEILKDSKKRIRDYNLPIIPNTYYVQLEEAGEAIREIVKELEKKPITITVLNTRVDTARDLVLKLSATTGEMLKTAMFAEMAIVYGNRYRSTEDDLEKALTYAQVLFFKGNYQQSLEISINSLNKIEPGIYQKLLNLYGNKNV